MGIVNGGLAFIKFVATPIEELDWMIASIIDNESVLHEDLVKPFKLLK